MLHYSCRNIHRRMHLRTVSSLHECWCRKETNFMYCKKLSNINILENRSWVKLNTIPFYQFLKLVTCRRQFANKIQKKKLFWVFDCRRTHWNNGILKKIEFYPIFPNSQLFLLFKMPRKTTLLFRLFLFSTKYFYWF